MRFLRALARHASEPVLYEMLARDGTLLREASAELWRRMRELQKADGSSHAAGAMQTVMVPLPVVVPPRAPPAVSSAYDSYGTYAPDAF